MRTVKLKNSVGYFWFNWIQRDHLLSRSGLILSNKQINVIDSHSYQKDEGYDGRGVGHSCLLHDVSFEIIQTKDSISKKIEV